MFDISFSELLVIAVVALVVIGPEKLPKVARTAGAFFGRMQRFVAQVKDEVNRESRFAELQHLQEEVKSSLQEGMQGIQRSILPPEPTIIEAEEVIAETKVLVKKTSKPRAASKSLTAKDSAEVAKKTSKARVERPSIAQAVTETVKKPRSRKKSAVDTDAMNTVQASD